MRCGVAELQRIHRIVRMSDEYFVLFFTLFTFSLEIRQKLSLPFNYSVFKKIHNSTTIVSMY